MIDGHSTRVKDSGDSGSEMDIGKDSSDDSWTVRNGAAWLHQSPGSRKQSLVFTVKVFMIRVETTYAGIRSGRRDSRGFRCTTDHHPAWAVLGAETAVVAVVVASPELWEGAELVKRRRHQRAHCCC